MEHKTQVDLSPYIVNVQGKDFITFPGLLAEAHAQGLITIETSLINEDFTNPVIKAIVVLKDDNSPSKVKTFTGYGDANVSNVAKKVAGALIRMAETRAVARALRFACNIDMTALEEISAEDDTVTVKTKTAPTNVAAPKLNFTPNLKPVETVEKVEAKKEEAPAPKIEAPKFGRRPKVEPTFP